METFGAWDRSQQQKQPPGLAECPSYPWTFRLLAAGQGTEAVRGTGPLLSSAYQEASREDDLALAPRPSPDPPRVNLLVACLPN